MGGITRYQCCLVTDQARLNSVKHPSDKILMIEANEQTVIDGVWVPPPAQGSYLNDLGDRHDRHGGMTTGRGNVAFVDTHVEFVTPTYVHDPQHYMPF
jgi:prepilin-type processing-associated H-X9-DG protein